MEYPMSSVATIFCTVKFLVEAHIGGRVHADASISNQACSMLKQSSLTGPYSRLMTRVARLK